LTVLGVLGVSAGQPASDGGLLITTGALPTTGGQQLKIFSGSAHRADQSCGDLLRVPSAAEAAAVPRHGGLVQIDENIRGPTLCCSRPAPTSTGTCGAVRDDRCVPPIVGVAHHRGDPYYGYSRRDRRTAARADFGEADGDLITAGGANRVLTMDHKAQIRGSLTFRRPSVAAPVIIDYLRVRVGRSDDRRPTRGRPERARAYAKRLGAKS
jgi:hypothetical protein